jgi:hypothetical protein
MPLYRDILKEIRAVTDFLVVHGLADDQNYPFETHRAAGTIVLHYSNTAGFASLLRNRPYSDTYIEQRDERSYNVRMLDGALVQMVYEFEAGRLRRYRLAFLPSPDLLEFQNNPNLYMEEHLYADVIDRRVVTVPLRFDYDCRADVVRPLEHPESHLTLGQYERCRVPATAPMTPYLFIEFILRSFYNSAVGSISNELPSHPTRFPRCIDPSEESVVHIGVPAATR